VKLDRSKLFATALQLASRARGTLLALRANDVDLDAGARSDLLAKAVAREEVRLELVLRSYEQETGKPNRNFVRFRDGAMLRIGASGAGNPFLRDHRQGDVTARGGTVLKSKTTKVDEGSYRIDQTVELVEPAAVERALRGLMSSVSIAWNPIGPVMCSACAKPVLERGWCWHFPGDRIRTGETEFTVEWVFDDAELVETSEVSVPGVPGAGVEGIRAALSALTGGEPLPFTGDEESQESNRTMKLTLLAALAAIPALGLAATAGEDEALHAVNDALTERDQLAAKLEVADSERKRLAAEVATYRATEAQHAADEFIRLALAEGRIATVDEKAWRRLYAVDPKGAQADMADRPPGSATPVGLTRQSDKLAPAVGPEVLTDSHRARIKEMGMTEAEYFEALRSQGKGN
jgi:hypothetical protein